jgi:hypothetical protein
LYLRSKDPHYALQPGVLLFVENAFQFFRFFVDGQGRGISPTKWAKSKIFWFFGKGKINLNNTYHDASVVKSKKGRRPK